MTKKEIKGMTEQEAREELEWFFESLGIDRYGFYTDVLDILTHKAAGYIDLDAFVDKSIQFGVSGLCAHFEELTDDAKNEFVRKHEKEMRRYLSPYVSSFDEEEIKIINNDLFGSFTDFFCGDFQQRYMLLEEHEQEEEALRKEW